jgi:uncharacterized membrane protein YjjB (DUF3815 family)
MKKVLSLIPAMGFFIYFVLTLEELKLSSVLGTLAMSIALGGIGYFHFNSPAGMRKSETAFGITSKYRNPVHGTVIPPKVFVGLVSAIILVCLAGLVAYHYGI